LCPRYTCQVISGVRVGKSPAWIASRLLATGSRPINNVVDITKFVMKEWAQPLHAFDLSKVREKVVVRRFKPGESLKLLDGRTMTASADDTPLAIADSFAPMALAGIMGGEPTSISENTVDVLLEAAYFEPTAIRLSSRRLGVSTDSSYRFERGMDPDETLDAARDRATALLFSDAGARSAGPVTDAYPRPVKRAVFSMPAERVSSYLGISVTRDQAASALEKLGYRCSADLSAIEVPTRRVDVNDAVVLIEDVARVIGYDAITGVPSAETPTAGATTALDAARQTARGLLAGNGFLELRGVPLEPLEGEADFSQLKGDSITLTNPLNADLARLRRSLVPFLLKTAEHNAKRRSTTFRYFEIDKVFSRPSTEPEEHWALGILLGGALNDCDWSTRRDVDLFDLKGIVESILETLRAPRASFTPASLPGYAEGTAAQIIAKGAPVGLIGQISPELLTPRKIQTAVFAAELFLAELVPEARSSAAFEPLPRFPAVFRDLSFVVKNGIAYASIEQAIRSAAGTNLETLDCIDVFEGKGIAKDSRSVAVSMVFRATDRTLSSEEVTAEVDKIVARLSAEFSAELRRR
jgi:phenylalanyl-tRNA synthetase beta chain